MQITLANYTSLLPKTQDIKILYTSKIIEIGADL